MPSINKIVIHCSDSPHGRGDDAETIHRWHLERGWSGVGYHHIITEDGEVQAGRPEYWPGAHVRGHNNTGSIGICLIGEGYYTPAQYDALQAILSQLISKYPDAWIVGHGELDNGKDCPMFNVQDWLQERGFM